MVHAYDGVCYENRPAEQQHVARLRLGGRDLDQMPARGGGEPIASAQSGA